MDRKLSAILAADVVGYSAQMERDEAGTFERLRAGRKELFEPEIARHHGHIFKLMGDGMLAEFGSVVDAVECAVSLQRRLGERNASLSEAERIQVRIGINLGEVIVEGEDRYGDGVNVAARLEGLADPGGVLVSGTVFDQVERRLDYRFEFLGEQQVKNIERPVRLYRVDMLPKASAKVAARESKHDRARHWIASVAVALILAGGAAALWKLLESYAVPPVEVASTAKMVVPLPDKPSIAVLPFTNMSSEPGQENFIDGMTDALITDLSKISGLFIISRNSTFVYKGKAVKISQVAEELGVRYVLEGSVQRAGDQVRVNAQLIDTLTGAHAWADRYDGNIVNIFATQDAFVAKIVEALQIKLTSAEKQEISSGKTKDINAKEAFDEGWSLYLRYSSKDNATAIGALERAVEIDPSYGRAYAALSLAYLRIYDSIWFEEFGMSRSEVWTKVTNYLQLAEKYPTSLSHVARAMVDTCIGSAQEARRDAGRAVALDPNDPEAHIAMAFALTVSGEPAEALEFVAAAKRLNPNYPSHYILAQAIALFASDKLDEAVGVLEEGAKRNPEAVALLVPLSSILTQLGRQDEARQVISKGWPEASQTEIENLPAAIVFPYQWDRAHRRIQDRLVDGFRAATVAPEITVSTLVNKLKSGNSFAVVQLGWFGPGAKEAVPALIVALENNPLSLDVVRTLGKIGPGASAAIPALSAIKDDALVGDDVKDAIKQIAGY